MTAAGVGARSWADGRAGTAVVAAAALAVFLPSCAGEFVWDDHFFLDSEFVRSPDSLGRAFTDAAAADPFGFVRPLRTLEFALDHALGGGRPWIFHFHSVLWHAAGCVLLLLVLRRLLGDGRAAIAAALFWAVHPVQVESVAWIACRGDVAMAACVMAAVLFALKSRGKDAAFAVSLAAAAAALLYKETAVALWIVVAVLRWTGLTRVPVWPYAAVAGLFLVYRQSVNVTPLGNVTSFVLGGSTEGTFATMIRAFGFYVAEALLPAQSLDWHLTPSTSFADAAVIAWLAVHAALVASAVASRRTAPMWTLAVAWFYAFLLPVSNWIVFLGIPTAERYLCLPLAGAAIVFGWAVRRAPRGAWVPVVALLATFAAASVARLGMWRSDDALWDAVTADHASPRARAYRGERARDAALALRAEAAAMPAGAERDAALTRVRELLAGSLDDLHAAMDQWLAFQRVRRAQRQFARRAETNLANVAFLLGRHEEALFHADEALAIAGPPLPEPSYSRALALSDLGFAPQAMAAMRRARADGFGGANAEIAVFFADAARACAADGLLAAAAEGFATARDAAPAGPLRDEIATEAAEVLRRSRDPAADARERARIAELDAALADLHVSCPARRDHSLVK